MAGKFLIIQQYGYGMVWYGMVLQREKFCTIVVVSFLDKSCKEQCSLLRHAYLLV